MYIGVYGVLVEIYAYQIGQIYTYIFLTYS